MRTNQVAENSKKTSPTANMTGKITKANNSWIIDSGASDHVTHRENWLENVKTKSDYTSVTIPNGETLEVKRVGDIHLSKGFSLKDVLSVPDFNCNLLSVSKITRDLNCSLTFLPDKCFVQDLPSKKLIGMGKE